MQVDESTNLYTNMFQAVVQILIMFAFVVTDETNEMKSEIQEREEAWIDMTFNLFAASLIGFMIILCATRKDRRTSRAYVIKMLVFMAFESMIMVVLFLHFLDGLDMRYGHEFTRKIFGYDPVAKEYKFVLNANKVKIGNMTASEMDFDDPELNEDIIQSGLASKSLKGHFFHQSEDGHASQSQDYELRLEPKLIFWIRMLFLGFAIIFQVLLMAILSMLVMFICILTV